MKNSENIRSSSFKNAVRQDEGNSGAFLYPFHANAYGIHHTPSRSTSKSQPTVVKQYNNNDNDNNK